jgi:nucleoside-diphosphate-sugar epimerase
MRALAEFTSPSAGSAPTLDPGRIRRTDRPLLLADPALAHKLLDWSPRISLLDGLRAAWERPVGAGVTLA